MCYLVSGQHITLLETQCQCTIEHIKQELINCSSPVPIIFVATFVRRSRLIYQFKIYKEFARIKQQSFQFADTYLTISLTTFYFSFTRVVNFPNKINTHLRIILQQHPCNAAAILSLLQSPRSDHVTCNQLVLFLEHCTMTARMYSSQN